ncbi:nucleotide exchange factor GrpE [Gandjariella thermophila]|uniref:nucleotide exchange factor GrpE n=1 Tax=Gandjariella thermophila TaxID=1931992 RepID=UPI001CEF9135|nr:nucleotide exchange factor GrpE [Gandjariella thermophila]
MNDQGTEEPRVVVRDRRRIDPQTGQVRAPAAGQQPAAGAAEAKEASAPQEAKPSGRHAAPEPAGEAGGATVTVDAGEVEELRKQLDERTADLKRLSAEYANYRKRVDRDRELVASTAKGQLANDLLPVLDDLERAETHGDLTGAFKAVADKIIATLNKAGLEAFGHEGEPFDPSVHEAVQHSTSPEVNEPTVTAVLRRGYRFGDRVIRAALVGVTDHEPEPATPEVPVAPGIPEPPTAEAPGDKPAEERD